MFNLNLTADQKDAIKEAAIWLAQEVFIVLPARLLIFLVKMAVVVSFKAALLVIKMAAKLSWNLLKASGKGIAKVYTRCLNA